MMTILVLNSPDPSTFSDEAAGCAKAFLEALKTKKDGAHTEAAISEEDLQSLPS